MHNNFRWIRASYEKIITYEVNAPERNPNNEETEGEMLRRIATGTGGSMYVNI